MNLYGEQSLVNLINHKGHEKPVKDAFEKYMAEVWHTLSLIRAILLSDAF